LYAGKWSKSVGCSGRRVKGTEGLCGAKDRVKSGLSWGIGFEICGETVWRELGNNGQPNRLSNRRGVLSNPGTILG
jgi:hypothetical protein